MNIPYVMRKCNKCGRWLVASKDNFYKQKGGKYELGSKCKECEKKRRKQYYEANTQKVAEQTKQYREANRDKVLKYQRQYYKANKEKIDERHKQYYEANREKELERCKRRYKDNCARKNGKIS